VRLIRGRGRRSAQRGLVSTDLQYWTLFDIKNWTPGLNGCPETQTERLVQVDTMGVDKRLPLAE
jgi:hypothetical protein